MAEVKVTRLENYMAVREVLVEAGKDELVAFIDHQVHLLTDKAEKAKAREAKKRAAGDELKAVVASLVTDEPQSADEITAKIEGEDVTRAKVIARLTQLVNDGVVAKEQRREEKRRFMVYFTAPVEVAVEAE